MCRGQDICWRRDNQKIAAPPLLLPTSFLSLPPSLRMLCAIPSWVYPSLWTSPGACVLSVPWHTAFQSDLISHTHTHTLAKAKNAHTAMCMGRLSIMPRTWREGQQSNKDCRALSKVLNSLNNGSAASVLTSHYYHYLGEAEREVWRKRERGETREETCCRWLRDVKALGR